MKKPTAASTAVGQRLRRLDGATGILISGDSDLVPPAQAVRRRFPNKRIVVAFPPNRFSSELQAAAHASFRIWHRTLAKSQFPDEIAKPNGHKLMRPSEWKRVPFGRSPSTRRRWPLASDRRPTHNGTARSRARV